MANSLVDQLKSQVGTQAIEEIASKVGLNAGKTRTAVDAGIPAVINSLSQQAKDPQGASALLGVLKGQVGGADGQAATDLSTPGLMDKGKTMLGSLLGGQQAEVEKKVSQAADIEPEQASGVLGMITPMITNFIASKTQGNGGLNMASLIPLLSGSGGGMGDMLGNVAGGLLGGDKKDGDKKDGGVAGTIGGLFGKK